MSTERGNENNRDNEISKADPLASAIVPLGGDHAGELDLSRLTDEERIEIVKEYQSGLVDIRLRAASLGVDVSALAASLRTFADTVQEISASEGSSVTITNTQDSALGRTEIIMGNTEHAQRGRLTRSQTGERDMRPFYVIGAVIVVVIILVAVLGR